MKSMKKKIKTALLICMALMLVLGSAGCIYTGGSLPQAEEDEIKLYIQLDLKEDIGLFLIDYDINGQAGGGGVSNADKSMIKCDDLLDYAIYKEQFPDSADAAELNMEFTFLSEYAQPNYEDVYPEENKIPVGGISLDAKFGETYFITIHEEKDGEYTIVLEED